MFQAELERWWIAVQTEFDTDKGDTLEKGEYQQYYTRLVRAFNSTADADEQLTEEEVCKNDKS